jgi:hypothetical protein
MWVEMANRRMSLKERAFFSFDHQTIVVVRMRVNEVLTPDSCAFPWVLVAGRGSR